MDILKSALTVTLQEIFRLQTEIVSEHYSGADFGSSLIIRLTYYSTTQKEVQIFMILEEGLVLRTVSAMLDMPLTKMDSLVRDAGKELSLRIVTRLGILCCLHSQYQLESSHFMTPEQFRKIFYRETFDYSLLLNTGHGYSAFCVKLK